MTSTSSVSGGVFIRSLGDMGIEAKIADSRENLQAPGSFTGDGPYGLNLLSIGRGFDKVDAESGSTHNHALRLSGKTVADPPRRFCQSVEQRLGSSALSICSLLRTKGDRFGIEVFRQRNAKPDVHRRL
jgi:hypothetical protein